MKSKWYGLFSIIFCIGLFLGGCGIPSDADPKGETRTVTDGMGTEMQVPVHPKRVVSVGVSTDDMLIPVLGTDRIAAISKLPPNMDVEAEKIRGRIDSTTESVLKQSPDLVVVPNWQKTEYIDEIRSAGIPVYVYQTPGNIEGTVQTIHELANLVNEPDKGNELADQTEDRIQKLDLFLQAFPKEERLTCVYAQPNGIGGGKGSSFDGLCEHAGLINGAAAYGLNGNETAGREALISINPDVIFVPSDAYSSGNTTNTQVMDQLTNDPAFEQVKAVRNKRIYYIDARWLMSYSQFMVNAMEAMAENAYGY